MVRDGAHFLLPLLLITLLLLANYSPVLVGVSGCAAVVVASFMRLATRPGWFSIVDALYRGARLAVPISIACAVAGLVVGTIGQTGIGLQFTESVVGLSGGALWLALILVAIAALVLGMGLPATAAYIVLSVMTAPALAELGLALLTAHMIIFWLSQTSNVTPPIALAAFAGAGVAGAPPLATSVQAFRLASGLFVIPLMMAYSPLLLSEANGWGAVLLAGVQTLAVMLNLTMLSLRFFFAPLAWPSLALAALGCILLLWPSWLVNTIGVALTVVLLGVNWFQTAGERT